MPRGLVLLLVVSCARDGADGAGSGVAPPRDLSPPLVPSDGARLKARWARGPSGATSFFGFYDSQLKVECSFVPAGDDELRCLPFPLLDFTHHADPSCKSPVAVAIEGRCLPPAFLLHADTSVPCRTRWRAFARGPEVAERRTFRSNGLSCDDTATALPANATAYRVGDEIPAQSFVKGTFVSDGGAGPVQPWILRADDGAQAPRGWWDPATMSACFLATMADGRVHCVPGGRLSLSLDFADQSCREPTVSSTCGSPPLHVVEYPSNDCSKRIAAVRATGAKVDDLYQAQAGRCVPRGFSPGVAFHRLGPELPPSMFPAFEHVEELQEGLTSRSP